ncbi:hypothetical protein MesoLjLb_78200 [Mesorhizobium sp. L-8-3]|nr:hypothetical protein MesoLjLb_78200 [Mesorhizobium sp. L-8-3]
MPGCNAHDFATVAATRKTTVETPSCSMPDKVKSVSPKIPATAFDGGPAKLLGETPFTVKMSEWCV